MVKLIVATRISSNEVNYWESWQQHRDSEAGNFLVEKYTPLVEFVVQRFMVSLPKTICQDDIRSLAYEGLLDAFDKFDFSKDLKFETYATWRIKGAVIDGLRQSDWLPRSVRDKVKKIEKAYIELEQQHSASVTDADVSAYLGITKAELNKAVSEAALSAIVSIDETAYGDDASDKYTIVDPTIGTSPEKSLSAQSMKESLARAIDRLPEKEKLVVSLCYFEELKLTEIAEVLSVSVSRVSQLHSKAILRLNAAIIEPHDHY